MIDDSSTPAVAQNIITEYSLLTINDITTYVTPWTGNNTRQAQNNFQMYTGIMASLTKDGCTKILAEQNKYHIRQHPCTNPNLLFKLLMQKAVINTHETSSLLQESLSNLDTYMSTVKSNIKEFNKYVKVNWEGLKAHSKSCNDLMINLFKGYQNASDHEFIHYMHQEEMRQL
jgi:hypothetical protein